MYQCNCWITPGPHTQLFRGARQKVVSLGLRDPPPPPPPQPPKWLNTPQGRVWVWGYEASIVCVGVGVGDRGKHISAALKAYVVLNWEGGGGITSKCPRPLAHGYE